MNHKYTRRHHVLVTVLKAARERAGLTQRELSARLRRSKGFVHNVESGVRRLDACELIDYANACRTDPVELMKLLVNS